MSGNRKISEFIFISEAIQGQETLYKDLRCCFLGAKTGLATVSEVFDVKLELKPCGQEVHGFRLQSEIAF